MEISVTDALMKAIEAQKQGNANEADRLYTAILQVEPSHPDANHNLGLLGVSLGHTESSLQFFEVALKSNPTVAQFWISYLQSLVNLKLFKDASIALQNAEKHGHHNSVLMELKPTINLNLREKDSLIESEQILKIATEHREAGRLSEAITLLSETGHQFQNNINYLSLLAHCHLLSNDLDKSTEVLSRGAIIDPTNIHINCNLIRLSLKKKNRPEALKIAQQAYNNYPKNAEVTTLLANCFWSVGNLDPCLGYLNEALNLDPNYAEAFLLRGLVQKKKNQLGPALADFTAANKLKPHLKNVTGLMIDMMVALGSFKDAIPLLEAELEKNPDAHLVHMSMGVCYQKTGDSNKAVQHYRRTIELKPEFVGAYNNLGVTLHQQNQVGGAVDAYLAALALKPDLEEVLSNLYQAICLVEFTRPRPPLIPILASFLEDQYRGRPKSIARCLSSLLAFSPAIKALVQEVATNGSTRNIGEAIKILSNETALLKLMTVCPIPNLKLEALLSQVRNEGLIQRSQVSSSRKTLQFISTLAQQCFINEYVFNVGKEEEQAVSQLQQKIEASLARNKQPSALDLAWLGCFQPLGQFPWSSDVNFPEGLKSLEKQQVNDLAAEASLKLKIPGLETINGTSKLVQSQYEENPYPRWVKCYRMKTHSTVSTHIKNKKIKITDRTILGCDSPSVLIAGCGTGQHSSEAAERYANAQIIAIDLSASSLAYAERKTNEMGITNIEYMQADILDLAELGQQFDIIECAGVLHHMDDPMKGWAVLTDCLKLGGLMEIGLYSEIARQHIVKIRGEIAKSSLQASVQDLKAFREKIKGSEENHHKLITRSDDFFNLSSFRDLLFHVKEHRFTIPQIQNCLNSLELQFAGFSNKKHLDDFQKVYPEPTDLYDLKKWESFEISKPETFFGMYEFWCQKLPTQGP